MKKRVAAFSTAALFIAANAVCAMFSTALSSRVQAQAAEPSSSPPRTTVLVTEQTCTPARYEPDALWKALQVELGELGVNAQRSPATADARASEAARSALALITIGCAAEAQSLWLRVSDAASGKELARTLDTSDVAQAAQPRALALAVVALLESSWSEIITQETRPSQSGALPASVEAIVRARLSRKLAVEEPPPIEAVVPQAEVAAVEQTFEALVTLRAFAGRSTGLIGLQFGVLPELSDSLRLVISAEALWGRSELSDSTGARVGVAQLYWLTGGGGLSWHTNSQVEVEAGPRVLIGYGVADPEATGEFVAARNASGVVVTALLAASLRAPLGSVLLISGFDIGYTLVGVVFLGDEAELSGMADVTFGIRNGLAW
jgi:hypothetical protein